MIGAIHSVSNSNKRLEERSIMRWWRKRGNIAPQRLSAFKARAVVLGLVCHFSLVLVCYEIRILGMQTPDFCTQPYV